MDATLYYPLQRIHRILLSKLLIELQHKHAAEREETLDVVYNHEINMEPFTTEELIDITYYFDQLELEITQRIRKGQRSEHYETLTQIMQQFQLYWLTEKTMLLN